jgi:hypothetical protein
MRGCLYDAHMIWLKVALLGALLEMAGFIR